jgi:hypothetical protein
MKHAVRLRCDVGDLCVGPSCATGHTQVRLYIENQTLRCEVSLAIDFVTQKLVQAETRLGDRLFVNRLPFLSVGGNRIFDGS